MDHHHDIHNTETNRLSLFTAFWDLRACGAYRCQTLVVPMAIPFMYVQGQTKAETKQEQVTFKCCDSCMYACQMADLRHWGWLLQSECEGGRQTLGYPAIGACDALRRRYTLSVNRSTRLTTDDVSSRSVNRI